MKSAKNYLRNVKKIFKRRTNNMFNLVIECKKMHSYTAIKCDGLFTHIWIINLYDVLLILRYESQDIIFL